VHRALLASEPALVHGTPSSFAGFEVGHHRYLFVAHGNRLHRLTPGARGDGKNTHHRGTDDDCDATITDHSP
jgi:hypothetical protein